MRIIYKFTSTGPLYYKSFNARFRLECLNENWFLNMEDAREKVEEWRMDYNTERPHSSLNNRTPEEFALENVPAISKAKGLELTI